MNSSIRVDRDEQHFPGRNSEHEIINLDAILGALRRQWFVIAATLAVSLSLGVAYIVTEPPRYQSVASVLIDPGNQKIMDELSETAGVVSDESVVLSQVELAKSDKVAKAVSGMLDLRNNPKFMDQPLGVIQIAAKMVRSIIGADREESDGDEVLVQRRIVDQLVQGVKVERLGRTSVLNISYISTDSELSSSIVQAFAEAYLAEKLNARYEATKRAGEWLQQRIESLAIKASQADVAVQSFKNDNALLSTNGLLVSDQQLTQLSTELISAETEASSASAKLASITAIISSERPDGIVSGAIASPVVSNLQDKYLETSRRAAEIASKVGENHAQAVRLRMQMSEYKRLMFEELNRIAQSFQSDLDVATAKVESLRNQVSDATTMSNKAGGLKVRLSELEREAETFKTLHRTFLQKFQEASQQESFPVTEARIISDPQPALKPSFPKKGFSLALAGLVGIALGGAFASFREWKDRFFRTAEQVQSKLGLDFIGYVPSSNSRVAFASGIGNSMPDPKKILKRNAISNYVVENPLSSFAEAVRNAKMAVDLTVGKRKPKIVGVVSVFPGEGKSTIAANLAELLANQGSRVILIDADLRNPGATSLLGRHATQGLLEALRDDIPISELVMTNSVTSLDFLPVAIKKPIAYSSELLASAAMDRVISEASAAYEYIVIDLPPISLLVDAKAMISNVDCFLMVVEWGKTPRNMAKKFLDLNNQIKEKCVGVILNKVNIAQLKLYEGFGASSYYSKHYRAYFTQK